MLNGLFAFNIGMFCILMLQNNVKRKKVSKNFICLVLLHDLPGTQAVVRMYKAMGRKNLLVPEKGLSLTKSSWYYLWKSAF